MEDCEIDRTDAIYEVKGDVRNPVHDIFLKNLKIGTVHKFISKSSNAFNVVSDNVSYSYNGQNHLTTSSKRMR